MPPRKISIFYSSFLFTPSEGGSQSGDHGRVVLHPTSEGDPCFQGLLLWEEKHTEEKHFLAVVVHHLETLWVARRHGVHQPICGQLGSVSRVFWKVTMRVDRREGAIDDWQVIDIGCCALVGPGEGELAGVESPGETEESPLTSLWVRGNLEVNLGSRRWCYSSSGKRARNKVNTWD